MQRRHFVKYAGLGLAAAGTATFPSLSLASRPSSRKLPSIAWHLASSVPRRLDIIYQTACGLAKRVADLTEGKFVLHLSAAGEKVPAYGVLDAVRRNSVECGHTCGYYYHDANKTFSLDTAIPFGLSARQMNAWCHTGGGLTLLRDFFAKYNIVNFPGGNSGTQMGGWFRKEITSPADLKNLRIRIPGFGAEVFRSLGAAPQTLPGGEIFPALQSGKLDAAEWVGPYDDEKLGFHKAAKFYYYPAWWEPGPMFSFYVNKKQWERLPGAYQAAFEVATIEANMAMLAGYDTHNPQAIRRLIQQGVELRRYPDEILKAAYRAAQKIYAAESAANDDFKKIYTSQRDFQKASDFWMGLAESSLSHFMQTGADQSP